MKRKTNDNFFEQLVADYSDTVLRIAYQHTECMQDAEDIAQEVFLSLADRSLPDDSEHLKAYVIRSTVNKCNSFHRMKKGGNIVYLDEIYKNENEPVFTIPERSILSPSRGGSSIGSIYSLPSRTARLSAGTSNPSFSRKSQARSGIFLAFLVFS